MSEKCFCHLNGFEVKDANARAAANKAQKVADEAYDLAAEFDHRIAVAESDTSNHEARIDELERAVDSGGSAKLYKHRVYISTIYNEETWAEDPDFRFYLNFYRSTAAPVTSFAEIQEHEFVLEGGFKLIRYDGPDANHIAIRVGKNSSGNLEIEYIEDIDISSGSYTNTAAYIPSYFNVSDTVYEV